MAICGKNESEKKFFITEKEYKEKFGIIDCNKNKANANECEMTEKGLYIALENRKLEIELYWKRSAYFWTLTAAALGGYVALFKEAQGGVYPFLVALIGTVFSCAWFLANKGSKYWQEHWEHMVDMHENPIIGPLFKTNTDRHGEDETERNMKIINGPSRYSVSKLNQTLSLYITILWVLLILMAVPKFSGLEWVQFIVLALVTLLSGVTVFVLFCCCKTYTGGDFEITAQLRRTDLVHPQKK